MELKRLMLISTLAVVLAHGLGIFAGLYASLPWFDVPMHFLGGVWAATIVAWIAKRYFNLPPRLIFVASGTALVGILWEFFEFSETSVINLALGGNVLGYQGYFDTLTDLLMDLLGTAAAVCLMADGSERTAD